MQLLPQHRSKQTEQLKSQIDLLTANIEREEEKAELLEVKCNMFNLGEFNQGEEDKVLESLNKKIEHVYKFALWFISHVEFCKKLQCFAVGVLI